LIFSVTPREGWGPYHLPSDAQHGSHFSLADGE